MEKHIVSWWDGDVYTIIDHSPSKEIIMHLLWFKTPVHHGCHIDIPRLAKCCFGHINRSICINLRSLCPKIFHCICTTQVIAFVKFGVKCMIRIRPLFPVAKKNLSHHWSIDNRNISLRIAYLCNKGINLFCRRRLKLPNGVFRFDATGI